MAQFKKDNQIFEVIGAGEIAISNDSKAKCGGKKGFHFTFKLSGETTFSGGLLSKKDAEKLANHILANLK